MPDSVSRLISGLPPFPVRPSAGAVFSPMKESLNDGVMHAHTVQTIRSDAQSLYSLWRNLSLAPRWQEYVVAVTETSSTRSHWTFGNPEDPDGKRVEYDSEITADEPGRRLAWRSITEGIDESGEVCFEAAPGDRGTLVTLRETAKVPGGLLGNTAAAVSKRTPAQIVIENLRHFKELAETGEIPSVDKNPHGPRGLSGSWKAHLYGENNPTPPGTALDPDARS